MKTNWLKIIIFGILLATIPFLLNLIPFWDVVIDQFESGIMWYNAFMSIIWAVLVGFILYFYFHKMHKDHIKQAWTSSIVWYLIINLFNFIVLYLVYEWPLAEFIPTLFATLNIIPIVVIVGYLLDKNKNSSKQNP